jgi:osmoprotectant transport system ATP-binding protein
MIELRDVSKRFADGTLAVDRLSLTVESGTVLALLGSSGSGKTTTLRMINRLIEPTSGAILLDGTDIGSLPAVELRRGIGYVIQQAGLFPHRTVLENVCTVPRLLGWKRQRARARAMELLELVGLEPAMASRYPAELSGGQQQRVGVARALGADPPVLLMDEPFGAVDPIVRTQLQDEFLRLQRELRKTVVFVTHDVDEAIRVGTDVAILRPGGVVAQRGTPAEVLGAPADAFVEDFLGGDRVLRLLSLHAVGDRVLRPLPDTPVYDWPHLRASRSVRDAVEAALDHPARAVVVTDDDRVALGVLTLDDLGVT